MSDNIIIKNRIRKTVKLTTEERKLLRQYSNQFGTQEDVAEALGIKRGAYLRISELGRGNSENIAIIREKIGTAEKAA